MNRKNYNTTEFLISIVRCLSFVNVCFSFQSSTTCGQIKEKKISIHIWVILLEIKAMFSQIVFELYNNNRDFDYAQTKTAL